MREIGDEVNEVTEGLINPLRSLGFSLRKMGALGAFDQRSDMILLKF